MVAGIGLHGDTTKEKIIECLQSTISKHNLSAKCIARLVSLKKPADVQGLIDAAKDLDVSLYYFEREDLAQISIPNPSQMVQAYEGTPSVSEAAAIKSSGGS